MASFQIILTLLPIITQSIRIRDLDIQSTLINGNSDFGHDLCDKLYTDPTTNIWISPFSITSCFSLIYPGSNGKTATQIANIMGYPLDVDSSDVISSYFELQNSIGNLYNGHRDGNYSWSAKHSMIGIANRIYAAKDLVLHQSYVNALTPSSPTSESFIETDFDFASSDAAQMINTWVSENTNGLITEIVDEGMDIAAWRLAALNAIYLNATFKQQFETRTTSKQSFYQNMVRGESEVVDDCHLMHQMDYFDYFEDGNYQYLKFPFSDIDTTDASDLFILYALPMNLDVYEQNNGLITDWSTVQNAISNLESTYIALALPKLSIEASYALKTPLTNLGMTYAFTRSADFSGISNESLFIDSVIHKTMVDMDENGLVAAAVTMIGMVKMAMPITTTPPPVLFKADHSFQMFIIDGQHENTVLFMGQINNPGIPENSETPTYNESADSVWTDFTIFEEGEAILDPVVTVVSSEKSGMAVTVGVSVLVLAGLIMVYGVLRTQKMKDQTDGVKQFQTLVDTEEDEEDEDSLAGHRLADITMKRVDSSERALIE